MPTMSSYLLETMIFNYYENRGENDKASTFVDIEIPRVLEQIEACIYNPVDDHKGIQGDINSLSLYERIKISNRAKTDKEKANIARMFEDEGNHEASINKWKEIFGTNNFPDYE